MHPAVLCASPKTTHTAYPFSSSRGILSRCMFAPPPTGIPPQPLYAPPPAGNPGIHTWPLCRAPPACRYTLSAAAVAKGFTAYLASLLQVDLGRMRLQYGILTLGMYMSISSRWTALTRENPLVLTHSCLQGAEKTEGVITSLPSVQKTMPSPFLDGFLDFPGGTLPNSLPTAFRFPGICGRRGAQPRAHAQHAGEQQPERDCGWRSRAAHTFRHLCWFSFREGDEGSRWACRLLWKERGVAEPPLWKIRGRTASSVEGGALLSRPCPAGFCARSEDVSVC